MFLPWWTNSEIFPESIKKFTEKEGEFKGRLTIGYSSVNFSYDSHVTYKDFSTIISVSNGNSAFDELYSKWNIEDMTYNKWMVNYEVKMTFSNPLYSRVTKLFFNNLVVNINDAFIKATAITLHDQLEDAYNASQRKERSVRDYINDEAVNEVDQKLKVPRHIAEKISKITEEEKKASPDFQWSVDPRQNKRRGVQSKSPFESEINQNKEQNQQKRDQYSIQIINELFKERVISELDKQKVSEKMKNAEFLHDIYLLDQVFGGSKESRKKIAKYIKEKIM